MSIEIPTTDQVRFAWADAAGKHNQEGSEEFDAWLASEKAMAWEEAAHAMGETWARMIGWAAGANPTRETAPERPTNPYR